MTSPLPSLARYCGTHDGSFHADEVTACALLLTYDLIDREKIVRTRNLDKLQELEYVCDVGGIYNETLKRFDHHQNEYTGTLSSAGMILTYLKSSHHIDEREYHFLANTLVDGVDAHDIGIDLTPPKVTTFSHIISNFLPISPEALPEEYNISFQEALTFAYGHIKRLVERYHFTQTCQNIVAEEMSKQQEVMIFDHPIPWMDPFYDLDGAHHKALYVIMPSGKNWKLRTIPPTTTTRLHMRKPLPEKWAGLRDHELEQASGVNGAIFCHKARFISVWSTKEGAVEAAHIACREHT